MKGYYTALAILFWQITSFAQCPNLISNGRFEQEDSSIDPSICAGSNKIAGSDAKSLEGRGFDSTVVLYTKHLPVIPDIEEHTAGTNNGNNIRLFPNPTSGKVRIEFEQSLLYNYKIILLDEAGKELQSISSITEETVELNLSRFKVGSYILWIFDTKNKDVYTYKIIRN